MDCSTDEALIRAYVSLDIPSDQVVADPAHARQYLRLVEEYTGHPVDGTHARKRLITLRKKGKLPRLRRFRTGSP